MLYSLLIALIIANILVSIVNKKSKILAIITLFFIAIVFTGSRDMSDWESYYNDYLTGDGNYNKNGQFLYYLIVKLFNYLEFSFNGYRFIISIICLSIYNKYIFQYSPLPNLVYAAYLSYLMFLDDVQLRNFIACAVLLLGISIIIKHKGNWRLHYFILVVIASLIHNSFWIYLIYLFIPTNLKSDSSVKIIGYIGLILTVIAIYVRPFISNIVLLFALIAGNKATIYSETNIGMGGLIYVSLQILAVVVIYYIYKHYMKNQKRLGTKDNSKAIRYLNTMLLIDILSFIFLPTIILALTFNRLVRNLFIMNIVAFTWGIKNKKTRLISFIGCLAYVFIFAYYDLSTPMGNRIIIEPFFNNNIYF